MKYVSEDGEIFDLMGDCLAYEKELKGFEEERKTHVKKITEKQKEIDEKLEQLDELRHDFAELVSGYMCNYGIGWFNEDFD